MSDFKVGKDKPGNYEKQDGEPIDILGGRMYYATCGSENDKKDVLIKELDKSVEWTSRAYANEQFCYKKVRLQSISKIRSFFEDDAHFYVVYDRPLGEHVSGPMPEAAAKPFAIQFMRMLDQLHKKDVLYLREEADNLWATEEGRLTVVGLDFAQHADGEPSVSKFAQWDEYADEVTDDYTLAVAIHRLLNGAVPLFEGDSHTPRTRGVHQKLIRQLCDDMEKRECFNYHRKKFLTTPLNITIGTSSVQLNDFSISWEDGIAFGYKDASVGVTWKEGISIFMKSGDVTMKINQDGTLSFEAEEIGQSVTLGPEGFCMNYGEVGHPANRRTVTINGSGLTCDAFAWGQFTINEDGLTYRRGPKLLTLGRNNSMSGINPLRECSFMFTPPTLTVDYLMLMILNGLILHIMGTGVIINGMGVTIIAGETRLTIGKNGVCIDIGAVVIRINGNGVTIEMGDAECTINSSGLQFDCNGFLVTVNGKGAFFENANGPIDLKSSGVDIPPVTIKLPLLPLIPLPPCRLPKKSKKPSGEISDHIECDEEVKFESLIVEKKPKGIGTKKIHAVVTSRNRMIFLNSTYYEKRHPDLELVPGMILANPNRKKLTIEHPTTGEVTTLKFKKKPACAEFTKFLQRYLNRLERITKRREKAAAETTTKEEQTPDVAETSTKEEKQTAVVEEALSEQKESSESSSDSE